MALNLRLIDVYLLRIISFANGSFPIAACVALAVRSTLAQDQTGLDANCEMAPEPCRRHSASTKRKLCIRRKDHQAALATEMIRQIETQKGVEHHQRTVRYTEHCAYFARGQELLFIAFYSQFDFADML